MKRITTVRLSAPKGMVLIVSLLASTTLLALTLASVNRSMTTQRMAQLSNDRVRAFYLAEAAVDDMLARLADDPAAQPLATLELPTIVPSLGAYWVVVQDLGSGLARVSGTGAVPATGPMRIEQTVEVVTRVATPVFQWALFGEEQITLGVLASVDGDMRTNSVANAAVQLGIFSSVVGDIIVGPGGNPAAVVQDGFGSTINGVNLPTAISQEMVRPASSPFVTPPITVPGGTPCAPTLVVPPFQTRVLDLNDAGTCYGRIDVQDGGRLRVIGDGQLNLTRLELHDVASVFIEGHATIVTQDVVTDLVSTVRVTDPTDASLRLYATNQLQVGVVGSAGGADARQLQIYYTGTNDVDLGVVANFHGAIHAPNATIRARAVDRIVGALMAKRLDMGAVSTVIYDPALGQLLQTGSGSQRQLLMWKSSN